MRAGHARTGLSSGSTPRIALTPAIFDQDSVRPRSSATMHRAGEVAERSNAAVLKTVDRKVRGFESHPLRHPTSIGLSAGEASGTLLSELHGRSLVAYRAVTANSCRRPCQNL
jgi:hypothetical protein